MIIRLLASNNVLGAKLIIKTIDGNCWGDFPGSRGCPDAANEKQYNKNLQKKK